MLQELTIWRYWDGNVLVFNHASTGHAKGRRPTPKFDSQSWWNSKQWWPEHVYRRKDGSEIRIPLAIGQRVWHFGMDLLEYKRRAAGTTLSGLCATTNTQDH